MIHTDNPQDKKAKKKNYLKSYQTLQHSVRILEDVKNTLISEHEKYSNLTQDSMSAREIETQHRRLISHISQLILEKNQLCSLILADISQMECEREKNVLILKYIQGRTWESICQQLNYSLRQIYNIHNQALNHFGN